MRHMFVCPMDDVIRTALIEVRTDYRLAGGVHLRTFTPQQPPLYPYVPAYFQYYKKQRKPLREFLRDTMYGYKPKCFLLVLHDDATDLESHALSEMLIACGAKETLMEFRAFLLSEKERYIAVTGSKRAVTVTLVSEQQGDTERIFIPIQDASPENVLDAVQDLDPDGILPVYQFGLPERLAQIGTAVNEAEIIRNFVKLT
ncbi:MAG TPA: hypothetical protein DCG49_04320 [Ruminococcus sp.]|nr:hypothetical protein [Ruminococcus sp.]